MEVAKAGKANDWSELSDGDINQAVMGYVTPIIQDAGRNGRPMPFELHEHAVQCLGTKEKDGAPNCPTVNDCINNRKNASVFWKIQRYKPAFTVTPADSKGFTLRDQKNAVPTSRQGTKR